MWEAEYEENSVRKGSGEGVKVWSHDTVSQRKEDKEDRKI